MKDAGIEAPDITLEQYADILTQGRTRPINEILPEFGLNMQTFAMVSGEWIDKMAKDPAMAARLAELMGATPPST
jgi:hypothetical protein